MHGPALQADLALTTRNAELHVQVGAKTETYLLYQAGFSPSTPYQLGTGEYALAVFATGRVVST